MTGKKALRVEDLMTERVITVTGHDDLATAYDIMASEHVRHLPVVNKDHDVLGLVSWDSIMQVMLGSNDDLPLSTQRDLLRSRRVDEVMEHEPDTTEVSEEIGNAGRVMMENKLSCLPVVDGETLIGILTEEDFVRYIVDNAEVMETRTHAVA